jgi:predicted negative regulator of RcsB-dependent stress response
LARLTRHQLKKDEFSDRMARVTDFFAERRKKLATAGLAVVVAAGLALGATLYVRSQQAQASAAFSAALNTYHALVMDSPPPAGLASFKTSAEKYQKAYEEFSAAASDYSHYRAGQMARYYAALCQRELGKLPEAEQELQAVVQDSDAELASLASMALASVYEQTGRNEEAEKIYRQFQDHPTSAVSKAEAQFALAELLAKTKPAEAAALYEQIQKDNAGTEAADYVSQKLESLPR